MKKIPAACFTHRPSGRKQKCLLALMTLFAISTLNASLNPETLKRIASLPPKEINRMADNAMASGDTGRAMVLYKVVCDRAAEQNNNTGLEIFAHAYLGAGEAALAQDNHVMALEMLIKGLKICENSDSRKTKKDIASFYKNIGNIHCLFEDYERGCEYYKKALEYCRKYHDRNTECKILINLTGIFTFIGNVKEAGKYHSAFNKIRDKNDKVHTFMSLLNTGLINKSAKKHDAAIRQFKSLATNPLSHEIAPIYICSVYEQLYKTYMETGNYASAWVYINKCREIAERNKMQNKFIETLKGMADLYDREGNKNAAKRYKLEYFTLKDSIYNFRRFDVVKHTQFLYETEKISQEISTLHRQKTERDNVIRKQQRTIFYSIAALTVLGGLLVVICRQKNKIKENYNDLYAVNRRAAEKQQEMAIRHLHDMEKMKEKDRKIEHMSEQLGLSGSKYRTSKLNDSGKQQLQEAIMDIMENRKEFCRYDFSLEWLAREVGSNSKYVSQVINDTFHKNFSNFVNEYRINLACLRLADEEFANYTIRAVAESVGFKSYATFITVFRKTTGIPPSMYQKKVKEDKNAS